MKRFLIFTGGFTSLTIIIGSMLSTIPPSASAFSDTVTATANASCALYATFDKDDKGNDRTHSIAIQPGTYAHDIGSTNLAVYCNTATSWDIYAVGYGNNTTGNTNLTNASSLVIPTLAVSEGNNSGWAMKLAVGTTTAATPIILGGYDSSSYHTVPADLTKVAYTAGPITASAAASIKTTYSVYTIATQASGDYKGKVKYTLVSPHASS